MAEKFRKIVNAPHRALFARAAEKLRNAGQKSGRRIADGVISGAAGALFWLTSKFALDNAALRKMEKSLKNGGNKYPNMTAHLYYYMMMAALVGGYRTATDNGARDAAPAAQNVRLDGVSGSSAVIRLPDDTYMPFTAVAKPKAPTAQPGTFEAYNRRLRPLTPLLVAELLTFEGVVMRDGMHVVYDDATGKPLKYGEKPKGIPTIGFGSTLLPDGSRVTSKTPPITTEQAYAIAQWHIEEKAAYLLYCYDVGNNGADVKTTADAFSLMSVLYNAGTKLIEDKTDLNHRRRSAALNDLYHKHGKNVTDEMVRSVFKKYPVKNPMSFGKAWLDAASKQTMANRLGEFLRGGRGMYVRRMIEAGILTGQVDPLKLLDSPLHGVSEFLELQGGRRENFWIQDGNGNRKLKPGIIDEFNKWLDNPVTRGGTPMDGGKWVKIRDILPRDVVAACESGQCKLGGDTSHLDKLAYNVSTKKQAAKPAPAAPAQSVAKQNLVNLAGYKTAMADFRAQKYSSAARGFEKLLNAHGNDALLRNDLAATYLKLGRYDDAISQARKVLHEIGDKSQFAAAQYNAGMAYEKKGDLVRALANYKLSVKNGNARVARDVARLEKKQVSDQTKKNGFKSGQKKVQKRASAADLAAYKKNNKFQEV